MKLINNFNTLDYELQQHIPSFTSQPTGSTATTPTSNTTPVIPNLQGQTSSHFYKQYSIYKTKKLAFFSRLPKYNGPNSFNLLFQFIFDNELNDLDKIQQILAAKKANALLIARNFELANKFLENATDSTILDKRKVLRSLEFLLTFLSNFFGSCDVPSLCPTTLRYKPVHYLQNLYGCGLDEESAVRSAYYKFVGLILGLESKFRAYILTDRVANSLMDRLNIRMNCLVVNFLNVDWELYDWKFLNDVNLIGYLVKNIMNNMPIANYLSEKGQTSSQVLEEAFSLSKEDFDRKFSQKTGPISKSGNWRINIANKDKGISANIRVV